MNAQISDDFDDGDFSSGVQWSGDDSAWTVTAGRLASNSGVPNKSFFLATPSQFALDCEWHLKVSLGFNTSSTNYTDIVLMSDTAVLSGAYRGYFVRIGNSSDEISLYRKDGAAQTKIIDGRDGRTNTASLSVLLEVRREPDGTWILKSDTTASGSHFFTEGSSYDTAYRSAAYFGILVRQSTASFFKKHFFDDFSIRKIERDTSPPDLAGLIVLDSQNLSINFTEKIVVDSGMIFLNGLPADSFYAQSNAADYRVYFKTPFASPSQFHFEIFNVMDESGNKRTYCDTHFTYYLPVRGDVRISEFMADPTPVVGLPEREFIELWNASPYPIDLENWSISDNSSTQSPLAKFVVPSDGFVILCSVADTSYFKPYGTCLPIKNWPSLNNESDRILLQMKNGIAADEINYDVSWYKHDSLSGGGRSLELSSDKFSCSDTGMYWFASRDTTGGTPGRINSVWNNFPDKISPRILNVKSISEDKLLVIISERIESAGFIASGIKTSVNDPADISASRDFCDSFFVAWKSSQPFDHLQPILLIADSLHDCYSNYTIRDSFLFIHFVASEPDEMQVIITEVMADPEPAVALPAYEYIELYNRSAVPVTLNNCFIADESTSVKLSGLEIPGNSFVLLLSKDAASFFSDTIQKHIPGKFPSLSNDGETLFLTDAQGEVIHKVTYSSAMHSNSIKRSGGWSLEMRDTKVPCIEEGNWVSSEYRRGGTPGFANSVSSAIPNGRVPEAQRTYVVSDTSVRVFFSSYINRGSLVPGNFESQELGLPESITYADSSLRTLDVFFANKIIRDKIYTLGIARLRGCSDSSKATSLKFAHAFDPSPGDIKINEILFNPLSGGSDFVELYNASKSVLDLKTLYLGNGDDTSAVKEYFQIYPQGYALFPGHFLAISESKERTKSDYPAATESTILEVEHLPSFSDDVGNCFLFDLNAGYNRHDVVAFSEKMHHPSIDNPDGVSLEKTNPLANSSDANFWTSASSLVMATPGLPNSQQMPGGKSPMVIEAFPKVFSPDGDGFDDFTCFKYTTGGEVYNGTLRLFSVNGILLRTVFLNELLAGEGIVRYDGDKEDGSLLAPGLYPVVFSYFNGKGDTFVHRTYVVVASK